MESRVAPVAAFSRITAPVAALCETFPVIVIFEIAEEPAVPLMAADELSVTLVLINPPGAAQLFTRLVTLTEPRPVARSYPVPAV